MIIIKMYLFGAIFMNIRTIKNLFKASKINPFKVPIKTYYLHIITILRYRIIGNYRYWNILNYNYYIFLKKYNFKMNTIL